MVPNRNYRVNMFFMIACILMGSLVAWLVFKTLNRINRPQFMSRANVWNYPFKTGDLILTCMETKGQDLFTTSGFIKIFTNAAYHHTAIVWVDPKTQYPYLWEMNGNGTRLATIWEYLEAIPRQYLAIRPINKKVDAKIFEKQMSIQSQYTFDMDICLAWYHRHLYPYVPITLLKGLPWTNKEQRTCAHMTTEMYTVLGVFDFSMGGIDPKTLFAKDYAKSTINKRILPLSNGYEFGSITLLVNDDVYYSKKALTTSQ